MKLKTLLVSAVALLCSAVSWAETDVTATYLTNADFSSGKDGWTGIMDDSGNNKNTSFVLANNTTFAKGSSDNNAEMWIAQNQTLGAGDIYQTLSNVAAGVYRLQVTVRSDNKFYLYALINGKEQHIYSETAIASPGKNLSLVFIVKQTSDIQIGVKKNRGESINTYNFIAVDDFKLFRISDTGVVAPTELTEQFISNWNFTGCENNDFPGWTIEAAEGSNTWKHGDSAVEYWKSVASEGSFDYYQVVSGLPVGCYTLSASMWNSTDNVSGSVNGECGVYGTSSNGTQFKGVTVNSGDGDLHTYTTDGILVTDGVLRVGVKNNTTMAARWFGVDWIKLTYIGNEVSFYSPTTFTSGSSATADTWYEFTVSNGVYKISSENAATFYYTQDNSDDADATASVAIAASGSTLLTLASGKLYFKSSVTSAITIAPFVLDGTYYLYDATNKVFLGRGANYGTRAVVDKYGVPFTWTSSTGLIEFVDWSGKHLFFDKNDHTDCWVYTDGGSDRGDNRLMAFTDAGDGKVYLQDKAKAVFVKHDNSVLTVPVTSASNATKWTVMSVAEHNEIVNAYPTDNINSVITNAGISGTVTTETFDEYLLNKCKNYDLTGVIGTASFSESAGDWTITEVTNDAYTSWVGYRDGYACFWQDGVTATQTIGKANLPAGIYKITMAAFDRRGAAGSVSSIDIPLGNTYGSVCSSYLKANGEQVRIKSWKETMYDIKGCDGNEAWSVQQAALEDGTCDNVLYIYLDGNTDLTLKVAKPNLCPGNYFNFGNFTLTRYVYNSNLDAITTNKGDITSLINGTFQENADGWTGGTRVTWVTARGWRGDDATKYYERDTNGSLSYTVSNMPAGTYKVVAAARGYDGGSITPEIAGTTGSTLTCVGDQRTEKSSSEINTNGVEMPYSSLGGFTSDGWGHNWKWIYAEGTLASDGDLVINFNCTGTGWMAIDDVHLYCKHLNAPSNNYTESLGTVSANKSVTNTGNASVVTCDIVMSNPNAIISSSAAINGAAGTQINNNLVSGTIEDMVLYDGYNFTAPDGSYAATAAKLYRNIAANKWITLVLPFVPSTEFTYKKAPYSLDGEGELTFNNATPANDAPMLVKNSSELTVITGSRASGSTGNLKSGSGVPMQGVYARQTVPVSTGSHFYYIVSGDQLRKVTGDEVYVSAFRAYFDLNDGASVKGNTISMNFGDADAIGSIVNSQEPMANGQIYNLAGQKMSKLQKGINIVNGKKILVK